MKSFIRRVNIAEFDNVKSGIIVFVLNSSMGILYLCRPWQALDKKK